MTTGLQFLCKMTSFWSKLLNLNTMLQILVKLVPLQHRLSISEDRCFIPREIKSTYNPKCDVLIEHMGGGYSL